ncbi:hypothetical protein SAMN05660690_3696 [Geodermatophilus telluris]|uniref:Histidine kinase n=1 Tax=Geodermatophilus telluris TaxID=1190417 RepID=A0A1G6SZI5_9ACTN|nr:hypothetical protein [Geodermatophilus telluris]SDD22322.1 hypothetical protein SAMN05660690_3696 [Geodermatophilus telluris]
MPVQQHAAGAVDVRDAHGALVREATLVHARARAAEHLVREDPVAAARALRGLTRSSGAVVDALRVTAPPAAGDTGSVALADLVGGFRASGGTVRFAASGPEQRLTPGGEAAVRCVLGEVLAAARGSGTLSVSLTWSPSHLDLLVVLTPPPSGRGRAPVTADDLVRSADAVHDAGGTVRLELPATGGSVVVASLPVPSGGGPGSGG